MTSNSTPIPLQLAPIPARPVGVGFYPGMGMFTESVGEDAALGWPESLGYAVLHGPGIAAAEPADPYYHNAIHDLTTRLRGRRSCAQPSCDRHGFETLF